MNFPKDFVWGAATAAYQIEGAAFEDGRKACVWDMLCRKNDGIMHKHNGYMATDHYHRYKEDVSIMAQMGLQAYRFSVAWSRVLPEGVGRINQRGFDFYDALVDELLKHNIEPWLTLYHWDLPLDLFYKGGWLNRETTDHFAEYTSIIVNKLSDRVTHWLTHNEIQCFIAAYTGLNQAPAIPLPTAEMLLAGHNALIAHGKAVQTIRANAKKKPLIGWAPTGTISIPATLSVEDIEAARENMFATTQKGAWQIGWWDDPVHLGQYPEDGIKLFAEDMPIGWEKDLPTIYQPLDFFATNIYTGNYIKKGANGKPFEIEKAIGYPDVGIPVVPESLYWGPKFYYDRYKLPVYITENGLASPDWISEEGDVKDVQRIDFIKKYLKAFAKAGQDGVPIKGYFHWSLLDNFEWRSGYQKRFGMVYVDYATQKRTLKQSAYWYSKVIASNGEEIFKK